MYVLRWHETRESRELMLKTTKYKGDRPSTNVFKCVKLQLGGKMYMMVYVYVLWACGKSTVFLYVYVCVLGKTHGR